LKREIAMKTREGDSVVKTNDLISIPLPGCKRGEKSDNKIIKIGNDLSNNLII